MEWLLDPQAWLALATLTALEIVLGVDNIIFISILCGRLPEHQRARARTLGLAFAMLTRIGLLLSLAWMMTATAPLFELPVLGKPVSGRDLILIGGGLFLLWKSVHEIHNSLEGEEGAAGAGAAVASFGSVIAQIGRASCRKECLRQCRSRWSPLASCCSRRGRSARSWTAIRRSRCSRCPS